MNITGYTRMGCLLGSPVAHSLSPVIYNECFREMDLDYCYLCFDTGQEKLEEAVRALRCFNVFGFNVTMPNKEAVMPFLDEISEEARFIGAVNTVKNENGKLTGYNTDGMGFMAFLKAEGIPVIGGEMTLLGAGGAAGAIAVQAALDGVKRLHLVSRRGKSWARAERLTETINTKTACRADLIDLGDTGAVQQAVDGSVLLTNATSAGMAPQSGLNPLPEQIRLFSDLTVADVIYHPRRTVFLAAAQEAGCRTYNGLYMLLYQAVCALRIWTGKEMPLELIKERLFGQEE